MVTDLGRVMKLNRAQSLLKAGRIEESLAVHAAIMAALTSRDAAAAQAAMRAHIESGQEAAGWIRDRRAIQYLVCKVQFQNPQTKNPNLKVGAVAP